MTDFSGQTAIVTGATRGIGRAVAEALLRAGGSVIGVYGGDEAAAADMAAAWQGAGGRLRLQRLDVSDFQAVEEFYRDLEDQLDSLEILVNNAGIRRDAVLALMKPEDWQRVIDVNLGGGYAMSRFSIPLMMRKKYGRIIFVTSPMAHLGFPGQANYAASKAGQVGLLKTLAREVARKKITVNGVSPGFIDTGFLDGLPESQVKEYKKMVPLRRFGAPEEVAEAVLFLAGPGAGYITGSVLEITGGL